MAVGPTIAAVSPKWMVSSLYEVSFFGLPSSITSVVKCSEYVWLLLGLPWLCGGDTSAEVS